MQSLYNLSDDQLEYQIIDRARFAESRRQLNTRDENKHIKETAIASKEWEDKTFKLTRNCDKNVKKMI